MKHHAEAKQMLYSFKNSYSMHMKEAKALATVGWREWVSLPDLNIPKIKAKIDTGAATSSLYAKNLKQIQKDGKAYVRFVVHPMQKSSNPKIILELPIHDIRKIKSSNGATELRPIIQTQLQLLGKTWLIELSLSKRENMTFRMLIGREALKKRILVDVSQSYLNKIELSNDAIAKSSKLS